MPHLQEVSGAVTKNLFLKDKKKKSLWLVSARHDRQVSRASASLTSQMHLPMILSGSSSGQPQRARQEAGRGQRKPALCR